MVHDCEPIESPNIGFEGLQVEHPLVRRHVLYVVDEQARGDVEEGLW